MAAATGSRRRKWAAMGPGRTHQGKVSAWLIKGRSDGRKAKWFQSLGRRRDVWDVFSAFGRLSSC